MATFIAFLLLLNAHDLAYLGQRANFFGTAREEQSGYITWDSERMKLYLIDPARAQQSLGLPASEISIFLDSLGTPNLDLDKWWYDIYLAYSCRATLGEGLERRKPMHDCIDFKPVVYPFFEGTTVSIGLNDTTPLWLMEPKECKALLAELQALSKQQLTYRAQVHVELERSDVDDFMGLVADYKALLADCSESGNWLAMTVR